MKKLEKMKDKNSINSKLRNKSKKRIRVNDIVGIDLKIYYRAPNREKNVC